MRLGWDSGFVGKIRGKGIEFRGPPLQSNHRLESIERKYFMACLVLVAGNLCSSTFKPGRAFLMKKLSGLLLVSCLFCGGSSILTAQESADGTMAPPKVLVIQREFVKPGKAGSAHDKTESAFVRAMVAAKWPTHYLGMNSLSGPSRALFFIGYDSFAAWEKDNMDTQKNATLSAALDRASLEDGELLSGYESSVFVYRDEYSLRAPVNIGEMRYMEITRFKIREGHRKDWDALVKIYRDAYEKSVPEAHWAMFESMYGMDNGGVYLMIAPMKSASEIDHELSADDAFDASMSASDSKRIAELAAASIESAQSNLFQFDPKMSYPRDMWVKSDPDFWKPKMMAMKKEVKSAQ